MVTEFAGGSVRGFLHRDAGPAAGGLVLTHGAGSNCQTPLLVAVAKAFEEAGIWVLRCDLAFRQQRAAGPPFPANAAADRQGLKEAVNELSSLVGAKACLGGHSYGGRQASMLAAEDREAAACLLLLSYPLHPPKKPLQLRTAHFANLVTPALFVQGADDQFGSIAEFQTALEQIPGATELRVIEKAGHDLKRGKFDIAGLLVAPFLSLMRRQNGGT